MTSTEVREKFIKFFVEQGHKQIPSASLVPENDPTTLFISAGMQPLIPYLLGKEHSQGRRLVNWQKCLRTNDIDEVGDTFHHTFFEMLGNWSLGDYFKAESIPWSLEFLTKELGLKKEKISVSVFAGDDNTPRDEESASIWKKLGIPESRIYYYSKRDNWWAAGPTGPCGPDTEMFYDVTGKSHGPNCEPNDNCGRYFEIWNNVFMVYNKNADGSLEELPKKNVDTGMGLERITAVLQGKNDDYETDLFAPIIKSIEELSGKSYSGTENKRSIRVVADHMRAVAFLIADGVIPANVERGYVLRRLIRRAVRGANRLGVKDKFGEKITKVVVNEFSSVYPELTKRQNDIYNIVAEEEERFRGPINWVEQYKQDLEAADKKGLIKRIGQIPILDKTGVASGRYVFENYQTYGVPPDLAEDIVKEVGLKFNSGGFQKAMEEHQQKSRTSSAGMFKGGLAGDTPETRKLHTATHLLHQALRIVLGEHVGQKGSNITSERLRFDFSHPQALTQEEIKKVEDLVNEKISEGLPVSWKETTFEEAKKEGALAFFGEKYGEKVKVYSIGTFSQEVCGGPHVENTGEIGHVTIIKEESAGSGVRRIYAGF